jgi:predicted alpha/beta hydrolase
VIINAATSVRCRYYSRFADYLFAQGCDVLTYDYRGIGESRPASLRGFQASWSDWGGWISKPCWRMRQSISRSASGRGGAQFRRLRSGAGPSAGQVRRVVMVGAQFAYWRDYAVDQRWQLLGKWHVVMPLLTRVFGYFPGKRLGWLEDTPSGVVHDWTTRTHVTSIAPARALATLPFAQVRAATLAISLTDDPFGTVAATERLLGYLQACPHLRMAPVDISVEEIGHFAFFHDRFRESLWPVALQWLQQGAGRRGPGTIMD